LWEQGRKTKRSGKRKESVRVAARKEQSSSGRRRIIRVAARTSSQ